MPHLLIEFSRDLASDAQIAAMLDAIHKAVAATGLFEASHIRVRAYPTHLYRVGGHSKPFIHAQIRIHAGRSAEQKRHLSDVVLKTIRDQQRTAHSITVEVVEMDRVSYSRLVSE